MPTRYFHPAHKAGGVVRSLGNLTEALSNSFQFVVACTNEDLDGREVIEMGQVCHVRGATVRYFGRQQWGARAFLECVDNCRPDILYLNSFFDPMFTLLPLCCRRVRRLPAGLPVIVAPRGELSPAALGIKAHRKRAALRALRMLRVLEGATLHAASDQEANDILSSLEGGRRVVQGTVVAADIPSAISAVPVPVVGDGPIRLVYVARVAPIKGLATAITAIAMTGMPARLDVYGPIEDPEYWLLCNQEAKKLGPDQTMKYCGVLQPEMVVSTLAAYDLFVLPTQGESFGHSIYESLAAGVPVLIGDKTPWTWLREKGAGWDLPPDAAAFAAAIREYAALSSEQRMLMRRSAHQLAHAGGRETAVRDHASMLRSVLDGSVDHHERRLL